MLDLVDALHAQGYTFEKDTSLGMWVSDSCRYHPKQCYIDVELDGKRIAVEMNPDG